MAIWSNLGSTALGWMTTGIFWVAFLIVLLIAVWGGLALRKKRKFNKPVLELFDVGQIHWKKNPNTGEMEVDWDESAGIFEFELTRGGWFKKKFTFFGLWDYGSESIFRLKDMTPVYDVSHNDYRRVNGQLGLVVVRVPNDPKFVVPISKFHLSFPSKIAMAEIAPVDLRNAATEATESVDSEMRAKWEKIMPYLAAGIILIVALLSIMFITQYGKHMVDKSSDTLKAIAQGTASASVGVSP